MTSESACHNCKYWEQQLGNYAGLCSKLAKLVEIVLSAKCGCTDACVECIYTNGDFSCSGHKKKAQGMRRRKRNDRTS